MTARDDMKEYLQEWLSDNNGESLTDEVAIEIVDNLIDFIKESL